MHAWPARLLVFVVALGATTGCSDKARPTEVSVPAGRVLSLSAQWRGPNAEPLSISLRQPFVVEDGTAPFESVGGSRSGALPLARTHVPKRAAAPAQHLLDVVAATDTGTLFDEYGTAYRYRLQRHSGTGLVSSSTITFPDGTEIETTYTWGDAGNHWELTGFSGNATPGIPPTIEDSSRLEFSGLIVEPSVARGPTNGWSQHLAGIGRSLFLPRALQAQITPCRAAWVAAGYAAVEAGISCGKFWLSKDPGSAGDCVRRLAALVVAVVAVVATCEV